MSKPESCAGVELIEIDHKTNQANGHANGQVAPDFSATDSMETAAVDPWSLPELNITGTKWQGK